MNALEDGVSQSVWSECGHEEMRSADRHSPAVATTSGMKMVAIAEPYGENSEVQSPKSCGRPSVQSPASKVQSPAAAPAPKVQRPKSKVLRPPQRPKSSVQSPASKVQRPKSKVQSPKSKVPSPQSQVQRPFLRAFSHARFFTDEGMPSCARALYYGKCP